MNHCNCKWNSGQVNVISQNLFYVLQAWNAIVKGTESLVGLLQFSVDGLTTKVMEKITSLIADKKAARKSYEEERNRLEKEFSRVSSLLFTSLSIK